ncbi:hypothetical protein BRD56_00530 [Thermoplasmatales archaeon SW_10_69_26]|nr:MAG: hypothetical protein BRD56_00530 [Thermoplasmatales archaeon SW_10_69_26]
MPYRFVRAEPKPEELAELKRRLDQKEIEAIRPFGPAMTKSLEQARLDPETGEAVWVEEDHCTPPLATEREILEDYFQQITVEEEDVDRAGGWRRIEELPSMWVEMGVEG